MIARRLIALVVSLSTLTSGLSGQEMRPLPLEEASCLQQPEGTQAKCVHWIARIEAMRQEWGDPGLAFAVIEGDQITWCQGFGTMGLDDDRPITADTPFPIGSISKSFTAAAALQLVRDGKLELNKPIRKWLTDLDLADPQVTNKVTLADLLSHQTGYARREGDLAVAFGYDSDTLYERLHHLPLRHGFREKFVYSNWNYFLAGRLMEAATRQPYEQLIAARLLTPMKLGSATFVTADQDLPQGHYYQIFSDGAELRSMQPIELKPYNSAGGLAMSVRDLARWVMLHLQRGRLDGVKVLDPWVVDTMQKSAVKMDKDALGEALVDLLAGGRPHYGFGWMVSQQQGQTLVGHLGIFPGYSVALSFVPEENVGIVVMSNSYRSLLPIALQMDFYHRYSTGNWCGSTYWSKILLEKREAILAALEERELELEEARVDDTPTVPLVDCVGTYSHPFYGTFEVTLDGSCWGSQLRLKAGPNGLGGRVIHWGGDDLRLFWKGIPLSPAMITQVVDGQGNLMGLQTSSMFLQREMAHTLPARERLLAQ